MVRVPGWLIVASLAAAATPGARAGDDIGNFWLELRPRYNYIEESDRPLKAEGGTVRLAAGWRSAPWNGLRVLAEAIHADH